MSNFDDAGAAALTARLRDVVTTSFRTHAEAAEAAGVSVTQLRNYLAGKHTPTVFPLTRIASAAGVQLEWLISGTGERGGVSRPCSPGSVDEVVAVGASPSAIEMAAREDPARYGMAKAAIEATFGSRDEQFVVGLLRAAGMNEVFGTDLGFALEARPASAYFRFERETAAAIAREPRSTWPNLVRVAVAAQRSLVAFVAPCVGPAKLAPGGP